MPQSYFCLMPGSPLLLLTPLHGIRAILITRITPTDSGRGLTGLMDFDRIPGRWLRARLTS